MSSERILGAGHCPAQALPLYSVAQIRAMEAAAASRLAPHALMQRAGLALARLAMAIAPHARTIWIACGPGNNGGDGFEAAVHLKAWGKNPVISHLTRAEHAQDAAKSIARAIAAGVIVDTAVPPRFDACIDALFGIGQQRPMEAPHVQWVQAIRSSGVPVIAADCPSGLDADTGCAMPCTVQAQATLTFLGLKPGLFTAQGRDACGDIWLDTLGVTAADAPAAELNPPPAATMRPHASHKGSYGDVAVVGGDVGMLGAALLAARAALHAGAGRVYIAPLDPQAPRVDDAQPELMFRPPASLAWGGLAVVAGCGGGTAVGPLLPELITKAARLVLDADALNRLSEWKEGAAAVARRAAGTTVLTPHPLEAARLLGCTTMQVQANRLQAAQALAERFRCTVVLKGSGSVVAAPGEVARINPTGDARLATGGTGDVLAGMVGTALAAGSTAFVAASESVYRHGRAAQRALHGGLVTPASTLLHGL